MAEEISNVSFMDDQYMTFLINDQLFGFPINYVGEIIGVPHISPVPEFPDFAKGIVNVRGNVFPVVDMRLRFHLEEIEYNDKTCIIIANVRNQNIGFIVDTVDSVAKIKSDKISPPPSIASQTVNYILGVGKVNEKMIILLKPDELLSDKTVRELCQKAEG